MFSNSVDPKPIHLLADHYLFQGYVLYICEACIRILACIAKVPLMSMDDADMLNEMIINSIVPIADQQIIMSAIDDKVMYQY